MRRATRRKWAERVRGWRASGQTADVFCQGMGIKPGTLRWWSSVLSRHRPKAAPRPPAFIEVVRRRPQEAGGEGSVEIVVRDRVRIRVAGPFDAEVLRRVVAALEEA